MVAPPDAVVSPTPGAIETPGEVGGSPDTGRLSACVDAAPDEAMGHKGIDEAIADMALPDIVSRSLVSVCAVKLPGCGYDISLNVRWW